MSDSDTFTPLRVVIAALTYRRPDDLAALLPALAEQAATVADSVDSVDILIVDNDPGAGAAAQVAASGVARYVHAAEPGIASARNVALEAAADADVLIFIDDDERPVQGWLASLLATYRSHRSAAVVGPVVSEFAAEPDAWVRAGRFFDRRRLPTGTETDIAATNNLLLDLPVVRRLGLRFDERFGLTGGSDTLFTKQLHAAGGRLIWCDEAVVVDVVPAGRLTRQWVLRRAFRTGNSWIRTSLALEPSGARRAAVRLRMTALGVVRIAAGAAAVIAGAVTRKLSFQARGMRTIARGAGLLSGSFGGVYAEYRRAA